MIDLKDLKSRIYDGKDCIYFTYTVITEHDSLDFSFKKIEVGWIVEVAFSTMPCKDRSFWSCVIVPPASNFSITKLCAMGLMKFNTAVVESVQRLSSVNFEVSEIVKNM